MIIKEAKRVERMQTESGEAEVKYNEDHREEIETVIAYMNKSRT